MRFKVLNDRLTLWVLFGITGSIFREITGLVLIWTKLIHTHIVYIAADLYSNKMEEIKSVHGIIAGTLTDWVLGGIIGVFIGLVLQWSGHKNYLLKGIGIGLTAWICVFGFLVHGMPQMFVQKPELIVACYSVIAHCVFGGATAFFINKFVPTQSGRW